jgi:hypothetical protein
VVRRVADHLVPVALNTDRLPDTDAGRFFRALMRQWPQGLWVVAPDGRVIAQHYHRPKPGESFAAGQDRWLRDTLALADAGVSAAEKLPKRTAAGRDPLADRGVGTAADGSVRLAVSVTGLRNGRREGPPAVDSVPLTKDEWAAFAPPAGKTTWTLAAPRFAPALSPLTDAIFVPRPEDVTAAEVTATVTRADPAVIVVGYRGRWQSAHLRDGDKRFPIRTSATGEGVGVYDAGTRRPKEMIWLFSGSYDNGTKWGTASVIEWRSADSADSHR